MSGLFDDAEVISRYTRAQAIQDGLLVDLSIGVFGELTREAGFKYHIACTAEVFRACIELTPAAKRAVNDVQGRYWDILTMLKHGIKNAGRTTVIRFEVLVVRNSIRPTLTQLVAHCGPGDKGEPVITIMFPGQD